MTLLEGFALFRFSFYFFGLCIFGLILSSLAVAEDDQEYTVQSRSNQFEFIPCAACHAYTEPNPTPRFLEEAPHYAEVKHGSAQMWCTDCHAFENRDMLVTPSGELVNLDKGYVVCAQCHSDTFRDWKRGAHGKRIGNWQGDRTINSCMDCHNPHHGPGIKPRSPMPPPGVRKGLTRAEVEHPERHCRYRWEQCVYQNNEDENVEH